MSGIDSLRADGLRLPSKKRGRPVRITVNGTRIAAFEGETVHAALTAAGIQVLKISSSGQPRGIFCGMGICYECLVTIDNVPDQRACMTRVRDGMAVRIPAGPEMPGFPERKRQ
jgi:sarcosine oxidase subunit alpha